jgi:hypothetical protein
MYVVFPATVLSLYPAAVEPHLGNLDIHAARSGFALDLDSGQPRAGTEPGDVDLSGGLGLGGAV